MKRSHFLTLLVLALTLVVPASLWAQQDEGFMDVVLEGRQPWNPLVPAPKTAGTVVLRNLFLYDDSLNRKQVKNTVIATITEGNLGHEASGSPFRFANAGIVPFNWDLPEKDRFSSELVHDVAMAVRSVAAKYPAELVTVIISPEKMMVRDDTGGMKQIAGVAGAWDPCHLVAFGERLSLGKGHEVGHVLGLLHSDAFQGTNFVTQMNAVIGNGMLSQYSNPDVLWNGYPTGDSQHNSVAKLWSAASVALQNLGVAIVGDFDVSAVWEDGTPARPSRGFPQTALFRRGGPATVELAVTLKCRDRRVEVWTAVPPSVPGYFLRVRDVRTEQVWESQLLSGAVEISNVLGCH